MINRLRNMISQVLYTPASNQIQISKNKSGYNPFENPFVQNNTKDYAVNKPVRGGYFAGYYNGKPNIVGRKLFIEA